MNTLLGVPVSTGREASAWRVIVPSASILFALGAIVMIQPLLALIGEDFGIPPTDVRVSFSICSLAYAITFFSLGPLVDRLSLTRCAAAGAACLAVGITICANAPTLQTFNLGMVVIGASAAAMVSPMFPYMARIAPAGKRGAYLGLCLSATVSGLIVGRSISGILTGVVSWRTAMLSYAIPCVALVLALLKADRLPILQERGKPVVASYFAALGLLLRPALALRFVAGFLLFFGYLGTLTILTYYLGAAPFNLTVPQIGWLSLAGFGGAVVAPRAGALAERYGASKVIAVGVATALLSFVALYSFTNMFAVCAGVLLMYTGVYVCQPAVFYDVTRSISPTQMGAASSLYLLSCLSGGSAGSYVLGIVWQRWGWPGVTLASAVATVGTLALSTLVKREVSEQRAASAA